MTDAYAEWKNMPEFVQEAKPPFAKVIVKFHSQEDLDEFALVLDQIVTTKTKSIWYPKLERDDLEAYRYVDAPVDES